MNCQPLSDWILVKFDAKSKRSNLIEIAGDADTSSVRKGTVLITGPGKWADENRLPMEVKPGDRIAFLRWHDEHRPGKMVSESLREMSNELTEDVMLIRQTDILFLFEGDVTVDV